MEYTAEQQGVIDSKAELLRVNAFAGTGKTATLEGVAKARADQRILYLAFNKGVADEARDRFPPHVMCRTSHSLAFKQFGVPYKHKLGQPKPYHLKQLVHPLHRRYEGRMVIADLALRTVQRFFNSADTTITSYHVDRAAAERADFDERTTIELAEQVWAAMQDRNDRSIPMPHDGYLKLFQCSKPDLGRYFGTILLDEAQDTNPCLLAIFRDQANCQRVLVGDEHQGIYGFRGALNAMELIAGERHVLTASWRFGPAIAEVASALLSTFKGESHQLQGMAGPSSVGERQPGLQTAYLHRTNAGLFDRAVGLLKKGTSLHFLNGPDNYHFETIEDVYSLQSRKVHAIRDPLVKTFNSFQELERYAELVDDRELKARINVVNIYGARIPALIAELYDAHVHEADDAAAVLTTAHKAKGMEWDQVILGGDFPETMWDGLAPRTEGALPRGVDAELLGPEEANLLYVAATRARKHLVLSPDLASFMDWFRRQDDAPVAKAA